MAGRTEESTGQCKLNGSLLGGDGKSTISKVNGQSAKGGILPLGILFYPLPLQVDFNIKDLWTISFFRKAD